MNSDFVDMLRVEAGSFFIIKHCLGPRKLFTAYRHFNQEPSPCVKFEGNITIHCLELETG